MKIFIYYSRKKFQTLILLNFRENRYSVSSGVRSAHTQEDRSATAAVVGAVLLDKLDNCHRFDFDFYQLQNFKPALNKIIP